MAGWITNSLEAMYRIGFLIPHSNQAKFNSFLLLTNSLKQQGKRNRELIKKKGLYS